MQEGEAGGDDLVRILWSSNALWAPTGYGIQAKYLLPRFQALGHEVAQFAWYGLQGAKTNWNGIPIYPSMADPLGTDIIGHHAKDFRADVAISLQDIWPLPLDYRHQLGVPWVCWFPVDTEPASLLVVERAKRSDFPVVYSRFGERMMADAGLKTTYIPHGVDCQQFAPMDKAEARQKLNIPPDAFLVGMVAANQGYPPRKAFPENMQAFARFYQDHPERNAYLYLHTNAGVSQQGIDLVALAKDLGIQDRIIYPDQYAYFMGLPEEYLQAAYNAMDVLLASTMGEGFGIPIIEAQACGVPVITTNCTSMPELTVNGVITEPAQPWWVPLNAWQAVVSIENVYNALCTVAGWEEAERADRSEMGRRHMEANYDWDVCVERHWKPFLERVAKKVATCCNPA